MPWLTSDLGAASHRTFQLFHGVHLALLGLIIGLTVLTVTWARRVADRDRLRWMEWVMAAVLLVAEVGRMIVAASYGTWSALRDLPLQLCDWAVLFGAYALVTRRQWAYELAYFWGLGISLHAVITPDLPPGILWPFVIFFFMWHGGIIVGVLYLTLGTAMRPTWRSLWRAFFALNMYGMCLFLLDVAINANYGYLRFKPPVPTLFDSLGPWPWYVFAADGIIFVSFVVYYAPFAVLDWARGRPSKPL